MADIVASEIDGRALAQMTDGISPFPKDDINPLLKKTPEWNNLVAKAIWSSMRFMGGQLFYNNRYEYSSNLQYALGKQPASGYNSFLGVNSDTDNHWLNGIDTNIKDYMTKRINILVSKISSVGYDTEIQNINPLAIDAKEDYKARYQAYLDYKSFFDSMASQNGTSIDSAIGPPPDGAPSMPELPQNQDDLDLFFDNDYKTVAEIGIELGVEHHMKRLHYDRMRAKMVFDAAVFGVGGLYTGLDDNVMPIIERVDPGDLIVPFSVDGDYSQLPFVGEMIWMTVPQFRKSATGYLEPSIIEEIIRSKSIRPENAVAYNYMIGREQLLRATDVNRIAVMRYNYRSTDTIVYVSKQDEFGNKKLFAKDVDYYSRPKEAERLSMGEIDGKKIYRKDINTVYEGYWVVESDYVYRQGPRAVSMRKHGAFGDDPMGYKVYAPNSRQGIINSLVSQCIPTLNELQRYNLKLQQVVKRAIPKGGFIDLYALRKASLKWNNKELSDQQKIEMFFNTGWSMFTSKDRFQPGNNYRPFVEAENGMAKDAMMYMSLIQSKLMELDDIMGLNQVSSAGTLSPEMGKGVAEQQVRATDVALDWLYDFDKNIYEDTVESLCVSHVKSVKYGPKEYYDRIFGKLTTDLLYSKIPFDTADFGSQVSIRPTESEWSQTYAAAEKAYDKGILSFSQLLSLREIQSLKQARKYLAKCEKRAIETAQQNQQALVQQNAQSQQESAKFKTDGDIAVQKAKTDGDIAVEKEKRETLKLQYELQTKMYVTIEQAKKGLVPNLSEMPPLPDNYMTPLAEPANEEQSQQNAMLAETKGSLG